MRLLVQKVADRFIESADNVCGCGGACGCGGDCGGDCGCPGMYKTVDVPVVDYAVFQKTGRDFPLNHVQHGRFKSFRPLTLKGMLASPPIRSSAHVLPGERFRDPMSGGPPLGREMEVSLRRPLVLFGGRVDLHGIPPWLQQIEDAFGVRGPNLYRILRQKFRVDGIVVVNDRKVIDGVQFPFDADLILEDETPGPDDDEFEFRFPTRDHVVEVEYEDGEQDVRDIQIDLFGKVLDPGQILALTGAAGLPVGEPVKILVGVEEFGGGRMTLTVRHPLIKEMERSIYRQRDEVVIENQFLKTAPTGLPSGIGGALLFSQALAAHSLGVGRLKCRAYRKDYDPSESIAHQMESKFRRLSTLWREMNIRVKKNHDRVQDTLNTITDANPGLNEAPLEFLRDSLESWTPGDRTVSETVQYLMGLVDYLKFIFGPDMFPASIEFTMIGVLRDISTDLNTGEFLPEDLAYYLEQIRTLPEKATRLIRDVAASLDMSSTDPRLLTQIAGSQKSTLLARLGGLQAKLEVKTENGIDSRGYNGYVVWAKYGYNQTLAKVLPLPTCAALENKGLIPPGSAETATMHDLMSTPEGQTWWGENGVSWAASFHLQDQPDGRPSECMRFLHTYLKNKAERDQMPLTDWLTRTAFDAREEALLQVAWLDFRTMKR